MRRSTVVCAALFGIVVGMPAVAQQPASRPAPTKQATPAGQKATPEAAPAAGGGDSAALRQRVEQLEEQLVDMQVMVGTLESLARGGGNSGGQRAPAGLPSGSGDTARMEALEGQVRALMAQVEQLQNQVRQGGQRTASAAVAIQPAPTAAVVASAAQNPGPTPGFSTQVQPERDPIGTIIGGGTASGQAIPQAGASDASAKQLYETAYGLLLQQDYASAEAAFEEFLKRFSNDTLAGNAQYWLGETFYVRGNFKGAAAAFLKGYQSYGRSSKAPDSLLKLAMSLDRLGQRDSACASYSELNVRFPNAPGAVRSRAETERRRLGCA